ncbi:hypothetical protein B0H17DRAFT_1220021 [Mycena rosella]|nr:hypothetical protein B0H17DRAFT_1220021 [Mycena rosella]
MRSDKQPHRAQPYPQQNPNPAKRPPNGRQNGGKNGRKKEFPRMTATPAHRLTAAAWGGMIPTPNESDRFARLDVPHMLPPIVAWANALAAVDRAVMPSKDEEVDT